MIDPVRLCCGLRHWGPVCPDDKVMCCICFERFSQEELYVDPGGIRWDVCDTDAKAEARESAVRREAAAQRAREQAQDAERGAGDDLPDEG